jgi:hypothetical protein
MGDVPLDFYNNFELDFSIVPTEPLFTQHQALPCCACMNTKRAWRREWSGAVITGGWELICARGGAPLKQQSQYL